VAVSCSDGDFMPHSDAGAESPLAFKAAVMTRKVFAGKDCDFFHMLTVLAFAPVNSPTGPLPPRASIIASMVVRFPLMTKSYFKFLEIARGKNDCFQFF